MGVRAQLRLDGVKCLSVEWSINSSDTDWSTIILCFLDAKLYSVAQTT